MSNSVRITTTGQVQSQACRLRGFYVSSTSSGTLVLRNGNSSGEQVSGTITPAVGWHEFPVRCESGLHATIGGSSLDVTFVFG